MIDSFDVFSVQSIDPEWLGSAATLPRAIEMIRKSGTGAYFVFSQTTERANFYMMESDGELSLIGEQSNVVQ